MALRSQEEISLATAFTRTLRNVIALTSAEDRRVWPQRGRHHRAHAGRGRGAGVARSGCCSSACSPSCWARAPVPPCTWPASVSAPRSSCAPSRRSRSGSVEMGLGELEVELDQERVLVKLSPVRQLQAPPATGTAVCDLERGIVDGVLEGILGTEVVTKETLCWSLGDTVCQFEGYSGPQRVRVPGERLPPGGAAAAARAARRPVRGGAGQPAPDQRAARARDARPADGARSTSASCASTPSSSWPAPRATGAAWPSPCSTSTASAP